MRNVGYVLNKFIQGYSGDSDGKNCVDIDECLMNDAPCGGINTLCVNSIGSYACECEHGYEFDADGACVNIDECLETKCQGMQFCTDFIGFAICQCPDGYTISEDGCEDVDECEVVSCGAFADHEVCENSPGSYSCVCKSGYERSDQGMVNFNMFTLFY